VSADIIHIALGGTISTQLAGGLAVPALTAAELGRMAGIDTEPRDLATIGGPQIDFGLLVRVTEEIRRAEDAGAVGVIVTLGTDAIEEVAAFLADAGPWKVNVALTGSMQPGAEPDSDGPPNLRDAARLIKTVRLDEPVVVFAGRVSLARAVMKVRGVALEAFGSATAPDWPLEDVIQSHGLPDAPPPPTTLGTPGPRTVDVPIILSVLGTTPDGEPSPPPPFAPALIFVASGAGNLTPTAAAHARAALAHGSVVAISTRALDRQLWAGYGYPGGSGELARAGAVLATGMSPHRLRMFLLIALSQGRRGAELVDVLEAHIRSLQTDGA
jgi:L-asparaginase